MTNTNKRWRRQSRLRLPPPDYKALQRQVLERDGWRCQHCGSRENLHVHHLQHRSQQGDDMEENLITVCSMCHRACHGASN